MGLLGVSSFASSTRAICTRGDDQRADVFSAFPCWESSRIAIERA